MSYHSEVTASPSQVLPSQKNLSELLEKLLTVFGVDSILEGKALPDQPLQRESEKAPGRYVLRPMAGNDFHVQTAFGTEPSWKALLQLDQGDGLDKLCLPFCDVTQHPESDKATATELVERLAKLLRSAWPVEDHFGVSQRRQLGPPFADPDLPDYQLFRWLASKNLNPVSEGVFLTHLLPADSRLFLYEPLRQKKRGLAVKPCSDADQSPILVNKPSDSEKRQHARKHRFGGQIWSFTGPDSWVVSLPVVATILLLMTHPTKEGKSWADNPDRDLSWTLDSLHGFCRKQGLEEGNRHLSWSLGTFPDQWMYLNFIFYYFTPHDVADDADEWVGSGIRCDRRTVTVSLGGPDRKETFREQRVWFSVRTAINKRLSPQPDVATIGFILGDDHHHPAKWTKKDWETSGMEPVGDSTGVPAFQMLLWSGIDEWSLRWNACLDYVDRLHEVQVGDIDGSDPERLDTLMFDSGGWLAKEYFVTAHLLKSFRHHINVLPRSLEQIRSKWERIYPGVDSDLTQRFEEHIQLVLLRNWSRLIDHAGKLHEKLVHRIERRSSELLNLRNSLLIAGNHPLRLLRSVSTNDLNRP